MQRPCSRCRCPCPGGADRHARLVGTSHLRNLARLEEEGVARLVGVVDVAEPPAELQAIHHRSLGELLDALSDSDRPEIVIIATPIDTHVPLATEALAAGLDVYLEKPPVPALEEHWTLLAAAEDAERSVQVGFQARGGAGVDTLRREVAGGALRHGHRRARARRVAARPRLLRPLRLGGEAAPGRRSTGRRRGRHEPPGPRRARRARDRRDR